MAEPPVKAPRSRLTPSGARLILATFAAAFGALFLVLPKPVTPHELPPLRLDDGAFAEVRAESARLAGQAPEGGVADRLRALYAAQGRAARLATELRGACGERALAYRHVESEARPRLRRPPRSHTQHQS